MPYNPAHPYELIVFDWDGTIMDSAGEIVAAMQQASVDLGLPERPPEAMRELIGLGLDEVLARLYPELDTARVKALLTAYRRRYAAPGPHAVVFDGVHETLTLLRRDRRTLAVATGKSRRGLDRSMAESGLGRYFRISRCADEALPKPAPDMLEDILLRTATEPRRALMVGDTEYDMAMASAAGVTAVGVACGVHEAGRLHAAGAAAVLADVAALPGWLGERAGDQGRT